VEGDILNCFDNIDHHILMKLMTHTIADQQFIDLLFKFLRAGV
jgi:retron-type reverse transcriptase